MSAPPANLDAVLAFAGELRRALLKLAGQPLPAAETLRRARVLIRRREPLLARTVRDGLLSAWLDAARMMRAPPPAGPPPAILPPGLPPPIIRLPLIESAAADLMARRVLTPLDYARLDQDARRAAFTVARTQSLATINRVHRAIVEDVREGGTLRQFRKKLGGALDGVLSPSQVETVYRTETARAYASGQKAVLNHPLVSDEFPYVAYHAVHDSRVDPEHLAMESYGLNGTNIYRRDDPTIIKFWPPWRWNCRCAVVPMSLADAARDGVREAKEWLRTGLPPASPEFAKPPPFGLPPGWAPIGQRIMAVL